jgi:predicted nucleic acid-binding protein
MALGFEDHSFHDRIVEWLQSNVEAELVTCSIVELGFVRVLSQTAAYSVTINQARGLVDNLRNSMDRPVGFISDDQDVSRLPRWVKSSGQTTDGHLVELAKAHGCRLATFDTRIPGAYVIP